jgi:hypothetical protein
VACHANTSVARTPAIAIQNDNEVRSLCIDGCREMSPRS